MDNVALREYIEALLVAADRRYEQRFIAQEEAIKAAKENEDKWRANANEWRAAMTDREINFFPKLLGYLMSGISLVALILSIVHYIR